MQIDELMTVLSKLNGCTFAGLDSVTVPVLLGGKKNPMQGKVEKHCLGHRVLLFSNKQSNGYLNKVRRHLEAEGKDPNSFELGPLPWGTRVPETPVIEHNGKHYLQCVFLAPGSTEYRVRDTIDCNGIYAVPGDELNKDEIIGLNERSGSEHQNLDREVIVRCYKLESIQAIRLLGTELN